jgi:hypothetical protein
MAEGPVNAAVRDNLTGLCAARNRDLFSLYNVASYREAAMKNFTAKSKKSKKEGRSIAFIHRLFNLFNCEPSVRFDFAVKPGGEGALNVVYCSQVL